MSDDVVARLRSQIARLAEANAFEALGLGYDADADAVRASFLAATKKYHPSLFARMDRDVVKLANEVFLQLKDAYTLLRDDAKRAALKERYAPTSTPPREKTESGVGASASAPPGRRSGREGAEKGRPGAPSARSRQAAARSGRAPSRPQSSSASAAARVVGASTRRGVAARQATARGVGKAGIPRPAPPSGRGYGQPLSERELAAFADEAHRTGKEQIDAVKAAITDTISRRNDSFEKALSLNHSGKHEQARKLLQQVAIEDPKDKKYRLYLHYVWGQEHEAADRFEEARAEYRRALNLDPTFKRAHESLGRLEAEKKGFFKKLFTR